MMMDPFTKKVLWDFWKKSDDQEGVIDDGFSDLEEANNDDEQEIGEIFRIETNLTKTYEDYENELNDELEEPCVRRWLNGPLAIQISFDESDDEDYTVIYDKNSFSYKIIYVDDLKTDSENDNDKVNMPLFPSSEPTVSYFDNFDYFKNFEKEFPAIAYNDALTSKSDFSPEPTINPLHIDEFDETSLSELIMEYLAKINKKARILELKRRHLKIIVLTSYTPYPSRKIRRIFTSLKALDESFSSKNYVRKFLRALRPKWRAKFTAIGESNYLSSLSLDELIDNLKVHEMIMEKDSELVGGKREKRNSLSLKAKKESSDDENSMSGKVQMKNTLWW
ncbi:hypothetical protein Tco_0039221 [Tanacetum coccineum]